MLSVVIALVATCGLILYFYVEQNLSYFARNNVPYFKADPIFGHFKNLMLMRTSPADVIYNIYNHEKLKAQPYGGVFILQTPGIFLKDIDLIKRIVITDSNKFTDHYAGTHEADTIGMSNMLLSKGQKWRQIRKKMVQAFTSGKMKSMFPLIDEVGIQLDKHISSFTLEKEGKSTCRKVKPISAAFTMDVIATTALGIEANTLNNPDGDFLKKGKAIFEFNFSRAIEFNAIFFLPKMVSLVRAKLFGKEGDDFLKDIYTFSMEDRQKSGVFRNDLIDILVELKKANLQEDCDYFFTDDALLSQAATFFTAGFETTAQTMTFTLYELARHSEVQNQLREEIRKVLRKNDGKLSYDIINDMEYMDMVIKETLRMYPVLPFLDRAATFESRNEEYSLEPFGSFKIKHGMPVYVPVFAIHKDPRYFPEPNKFDPERFSPENRGNIKSGTYFPFGSGPRACIGERFGLMSIKVGLIYYLRNHYFKLNEKSHKEMKLSKSALLLQADGDVFLDIVRDPMGI